MANERIYYVICDDNCKFEGMTKEQIYAAIVEAMTEGTISDVDAGFITTIKELNQNQNVKFWIGLQAEYNALEEIDPTTIYIITDAENAAAETPGEELPDSVIREVVEIKSGGSVVGSLEFLRSANYVTVNANLNNGSEAVKDWQNSLFIPGTMHPGRNMTIYASNIDEIGSNGDILRMGSGSIQFTGTISGGLV